ncbi:SpoVK/Ycf46/Vps4 family AAA+-type ATPase [Gammaproteobacteria bacterium]
MTISRIPWRMNFQDLPANIRRAARYALQLFIGDNLSKSRLHDQAYFKTFWKLIQLLMNTRRLMWFLKMPCLTWDSNIIDRREYQFCTRRWMRQLLENTLEALPPQLQVEDGYAPVMAQVASLAECLDLDEDETRLLDFLSLRENLEDFRNFLTQYETAKPMANAVRLSAMLAIPLGQVQRILHRDSALMALKIFAVREDESSLEGFIQLFSPLQTILGRNALDADEVFRVLADDRVEPVEHRRRTKKSLTDFPHLTQEAEWLRTMLNMAATTRMRGVNILLHSGAGMDKFEFALALVETCGLKGYQVPVINKEGDSFNFQWRLSGHRMAQHLLRRREHSVLIFDDAESVLNKQDGQQPDWVNNILEDNPLPTLWIANDLTKMAEPFRRSFTLSIAFVNPPRTVRRQMVNRYLGDLSSFPAQFDELAADPGVTSGQLRAVRRLLALMADTDSGKVLWFSLKAQLQMGQTIPRRRLMETRFSLDFLNIAGELKPATLIQALARQGRGTLCCYGRPGTGKTAFVEKLAESLDRELVVYRVSDLISHYVGETERNLARMFASQDPARCVLFLDEADSFLQNRHEARFVWEKTQVNELMQQIDYYPGIFIAATNLMDSLDSAALRRFDYKLHFLSLTPAQRLALFAQEALNAGPDSVPPNLAKSLGALSNLTPGDFATVCRQRELLGEPMAPEIFLRHLHTEFCSKKNNRVVQIA